MKRTKCNLICCIVIAVCVLGVIATKVYSIMYTQGVYGVFAPSDPTWHITFALICDALVCSISACYMMISHAGRSSFDETFACRSSVTGYSVMTAICTVILSVIAISYINL